MRRLLRGETFIALRATRQGHQIARDVLYPAMGDTTGERELRDAVETLRRARRNARKQRRNRLREEYEFRQTMVTLFGLALTGIAFVVVGIVIYLALSGA